MAQEPKAEMTVNEETAQYLGGNTLAFRAIDNQILPSRAFKLVIDIRIENNHCEM